MTAARRGVAARIGALARRLLRTSSIAVMALVSCLACTLIGMLLTAGGLMQLAPGGRLSPIRIGRPAPDFELAKLDGDIIRLSDYRGHPVALNFWATWCQACVHELPALEAAEQEHAAAGLVVLAVNSGEWPADVEAFLTNRDIHDLAVPLDFSNEVYRTYRVIGLPTTVWVDAAGTVRAVHTGPLRAELIARYVAQLTAATPTP